MHARLAGKEAGAVAKFGVGGAAAFGRERLGWIEPRGSSASKLFAGEGARATQEQPTSIRNVAAA